MEGRPEVIQGASKIGVRMLGRRRQRTEEGCRRVILRDLHFSH